ncbi:hypothetical protein V2053_003276 [Vibrio cholerae]|nr:hypothetical protein [Vibrio cholerae]EKF9842607.1 hypothetical protein [Vibrio cholerae]
MNNSGFTQLVNTSTGDVIAQREGNLIDECKKIWLVEMGREIIHVSHSDYVHPFKFFTAIHGEKQIRLYNDFFGNIEPELEPSWMGSAKEFTELQERITAQEWSVFDDEGNWLGTSEY